MAKEKVLIASDHIGLPLKLFLIEALRDDVTFYDNGTHSDERCNYNEYACLLSTKIRDSSQISKGILICGTGVGMAIAANRHQGIRAVVCSEPYSALMSRKHNDTNILCLGSRVLGHELAKEIVTHWLSTSFDGGRHAARLDLIDKYR